MKHLFIIVTSLYIVNADSPKESLVMIDYSNGTEDIVVIPRNKQYDDKYIYKAIEPIIDRRTK